MTKKLAIATILALSTAACATAPAQVERVVLLDPARGSELLRTCSRQSPVGASTYFTPSAPEITALETSLARILTLETADIGPAADFAVDPASYRREYVGYTVNGERMIYGNFVPVGAARDAVPTIVCDGGPAFFGVEYAIDAQAVKTVRFDGGFGGGTVQDIER